MEDRELQQIKARADQVKKLLGDGSGMLQLIDKDLPKLVAEVSSLAAELDAAGKCPHGVPYRGRACVECFGDGTEEKGECGQCGTETWHRGGKCLRHDESAPKPYEPLKEELARLKQEIQAAQEQSTASIARSEERVKEVEEVCDTMRQALEYVKGRIGSMNIGESLIKIDKALSFSTSPAGRSPQEKEKAETK